MEKCSESYIIRSDPRRFLSQFELFESVSGTENVSVSIEVRVALGFACIDGSHLITAAQLLGI
jgi:hypothetical protein